MNNYDLYWCKVKFIDSPKFKIRPVVITDNKVALVMPITGSEKDYHLRIVDWKEAGLSKPSYIKLDNEFSIEPSELTNKIGRLSEYDIACLENELYEESDDDFITESLLMLID